MQITMLHDLGEATDQHAHLPGTQNDPTNGMGWHKVRLPRRSCGKVARVVAGLAIIDHAVEKGAWGQSHSQT